MDKPDKSLLSIRKDRLDQDCQNQPKLMYEWSALLAEARAETERAKNRMKVADALLELEIRKAPGDFGLEKPTEKAIEALILTCAEHRDKFDEWLQAKHDEDVLEAFVKSIVDRKQELENMVYLHGQMYWAKPTVSGERMQQNHQRIAKKVTEEGRKHTGD